MRSHIADFIFEHTLDFVAHSLGTDSAEMDCHLVDGRDNERKAAQIPAVQNIVNLFQRMLEITFNS